MKKARLFVVGASALALWGCGGSGGGPVGVTSNPLASGRAALTQMAANTTTTSTQSLQSALTLFQQALQKDPNSSEAHFGAAVCLMGSIAQQIDGGAPVPVATPAAASRKTGAKATLTRDTSGSSPGNPGAGFVLPTPPATGAVPPTPPNGTVTPQPIEPVHTLGLFWFLDRGLSNPSTLLNMLSPLSDLRLGLIPYYGYSNDAQGVARRQKMLTDLATVAQHLQTVEADAGFTVTLPAPDQNGQTVTIGLPEVCLFDAYVQSLRVSTALSLTYNRDPGASGLIPPTTTGGGSGSTGSSSAPTPPAPPIFAGGGSRAASDLSPFQVLDKNQDGKLTPDEYLPASPFLTLRDASYFQTAQTAMGLIVDRETKGITGALARPATGSFLIPNSTDVATALVNIRDNVLPLIQQATTGPVTLAVPHYVAYPLLAVNGGSGVAPAISNVLYTAGTVATAPQTPAQNTFQSVPTENVTFNISAWFAKPPTDLKAFAPTYTLNSVGYPNYDLTTYPDPTFGGLFPNGLPSDLRL